MASSVSVSFEKSYKNCLLLHLDCDLDAENFGEFVRNAENLHFFLEDLCLKMKYLSSFYLSHISARCERKEVNFKEWKFFHEIIEPEIKEEDFSEDIVIIIQKLVHCYISSFKTTILIYGKRKSNGYSPAVIRLCSKFLKYAFEAASVFNVPDYEHNLSQKFLKEGIAAMKNLAIILIIISTHMVFEEIIEEILPLTSMIQYMVGNPLIKVFSNCLLGHPKTSKAVLTLLLSYFSEINKIRILQEKNSKKSRLLLSLFEDIFQAMILFPNEIGSAQKECLKNVVRTLIDELVQTTVDCYNHLYVLKSLFSALGNDKLQLVLDGLVTTLPHLFNAFDFLLKSSFESKIRHLILETILTVINSHSATSFVFLLPYVELIVRTVMFSLKENNSELVQKKALSIFENFLDAVDFDYINACILPLKKDFLNIMFEAVCNTSGKASESAFRILGKMGGYNRDPELMNQSAEKLKSCEAERTGPFLPINCKEGFINLPLASVIDHAFKGLDDDLKDDDSKKLCWSLVETFLSSHIRQYDGENLSNYSSQVQCLTGDDLIMTAYKSMFASAEISCLSEHVKPFMVKVIDCLISYSPSIEKNKDLKLLIDAAVLITCLPKDHDKIYISTLETIVNKAYEYHDHKEVSTSSVFDYIVEEVILLLYGQTQEQKLVGCKVVQFLTKITSWKWKITNVHKFVRPLLSAAVALDGLHSFASYKIAKVILQCLISQCFASFDEKITMKIEVYNKLKNLLIYDIVSSNHCMREQARSVMTFMFRFAKTEVRNETEMETEVTDKLKTAANIEVTDQSNEGMLDRNSEETVRNNEIANVQNNDKNCVVYKDDDKECKNSNLTQENCKLIDKNLESEQGIELPDIMLPKFCLLIDNLLYLHEDFDFCLKFKMPLFHTDTDREEDRVLYEELKSLCTIKEQLIHTQNDVMRCCGALHTLCFNYNKKQNLEELFIIYTHSLLSPIPEISKSAVKCLQFIKEHVTAEMIRDWACDFLEIVDYSIQKDQLCNLKHFVKIFDDWYVTESLLDALLKHLEKWKIRTVKLCRARKAKRKGYSFPLKPYLSIGADLINVLNVMPITDDSIVKNVMGTVFEIERYAKLTKDNPLKEPYMTFCQKFPSKVVQIIISNLKYNDEADMTYFVDFWKMDDCDAFRSSVKESYLITLGINDRLSYTLQILRYIVKYNDQYLSDKTELIKRLHLVWNQVLLKPRFQAMSYLKDFKLLAKFLLKFFYYNYKDFNILFDLMKSFACPFASSFTFLKNFVLNTVAKEYLVTWKAEAFLKFQSFFIHLNEPEDFKIRYLAKVLKFLFIPSFSVSLMKGENEELLKECNKIDSLDVPKEFLDCVRDFFDRSEKVKLMFLKLSIIIQLSAQNLEKLEDCKVIHIFIEEAKKLAKFSLREVNILGNGVHIYSFLLFLIMEDKDWNINIQKDFLLKLFTTYPVGDEHVVQKALYLSVSFFHDTHTDKCESLSPCFYFIIENGDFDLVVRFSEIFYSVHNKFITPMVQSAMKLEAGNIKERKMAVDLIEVIIKWKKHYLTAVAKSSRASGLQYVELQERESIISADEARLTVNLLLRIACLVDSESFKESLSKKAASLLKDMFEHKIFPLIELEFGDWIDDLFRNISEDSKKYENCVIFSLMTSFISNWTEKIPPKSFVQYFQKKEEKVEDLLKCSEVKVLDSLCRFLTVLINKFPPKDYSEFGLLYKHIETLCMKETYFFCKSKATLVEAVGGYFQSSLDLLKNHYLMKYLGILTSTYALYDNKTTLNVTLGFLKKLFFAISEDDRREVLRIVHTLIDTLSHVESMMKMIDIMDLSIEYVKGKKQCGRLSIDLADQISNNFEEICNKINTSFSHDKNICNRFFEVIVRLRTNIPQIRIINVFAMFGTFTYDSETRKQCFCFIAEELDTLELCVRYVCDERWKVMDGWLWIKLFINIIAIDVYVISNSANSGLRTKESIFFTSLIELCYSDESLTKYVWTELFNGIWNILSERNQQELLTKLQSFILMMSELHNLHDVLITAALKCNPEFVLYVEPKLMQSSYHLQVHCSMLLEKIILSQGYFSEDICERERIISTLLEIYPRLEEMDVLYSLIETSSYYNDSTVQAVSYYKEGNIHEAYEFLKKSKAAFSDKLLGHTTVHEMEFCMNQMIRCASDLARWDDLTDMPSSNLMQYVSPVSKSSVLTGSPVEALIMKSKFCKLKNDDIRTLSDEKIYDVIHHCIKELKSLPHTFTKNHYSLLQLMQQLTELLEAGHLVQQDKLDLDTEKVKSICSRWDSRPYLLCDDFSFVTEILNVRQKCLENVALRCHESTLVQYVATHASNNYSIKLSSAAMLFKNTLMTNVGYENYSLQNAYQLFEMQFQNLLSEAKKAVTQKKWKHLFCETSYLLKSNEEIINNFDWEKKLLLSVHMWEVYAALRIDISFYVPEFIFKNPSIGKSFLILGEFYEKCFFQSSIVNDDAIMAMYCLLKACRLCTPFESLRLIPKILHLLEYDDNDDSVCAKVFRKGLRFDIPDKYWIPYLPFLISCLHHSIVQEKHRLSHIFIDTLQRLSLKYPQQVFFSLQSLRGIKPAGKNERKYGEIILEMRKRHPMLIFKLEEVSNVFSQLKTNDYDIYCQILKQALVKAYNFVLENLKKGYSVYDATDILDYLNNGFKSKISSVSELGSQSQFSQVIFDSIDSFKSLEVCTSKIIINALNKYIGLFSEMSMKQMKFQPRSFLLDEKFQVLSSHFFENEVFLFDQLHLMDHSPLIKIHKILPKVDILKRNNSFKINIRGCDGKDYSYLIMKDICRKESVNTARLMQLLENLNPFLEKNVQCVFFKFSLPRVIFFNTDMKLIPHSNEQLSLQYVYQMHTTDFSPVDDFFDRLFQYPDTYQNVQCTKHILKSVLMLAPEDNFDKLLNELYLSPSDYFNFRTRVLKDISMLGALEFLNICSFRQMLIHKNVDSLMNTLHLELNFEEQSTSSLMTPCMKKFLGLLRIRVVSENIINILKCLKESENSYSFLRPLLHLMKNPMNYSDEMHFNEMEKFVDVLVNKLKCVNKTEVQRFLEPHTATSFNLCLANQFVHLTF